MSLPRSLLVGPLGLFVLLTGCVAETSGVREPVPLTRSSEGLRARVDELVLVASESNRGELDALARDVASRWPGFVDSIGARPRADFTLYLIPPGGERPPDLARLDSLAPPWAAGFLVGDARVGGVRLDRVDRYPYKDAVAVTLHEATHQILQDAVGRQRLPRWFEEGAATLLGQRWGTRQLVLARGAVFLGGVPELEEIDRGFDSSAAAARHAYAAAHSFVAWSERRYGRDLVPRLLDELRRDEAAEFRAAWLRATGEVLSGSERRWRRGGLLLYRILPLIGSTGSVWILISLLAVAGGGKRRVEFRRRMERWRLEEEAAELRAARAAKIDPDAEQPAPTARERARQRWGLPSAGATEPQRDAEGRPPRRSDDGEWIN